MIKMRRRQYLVNRPAQLRYMSIVAIPLVVLLGALYYLIYYSVFSQMMIPEAIAQTLLPAMKRVNLVVLFTAPVLLFIILRAALVYSNKIVGPIPRVEKELDRVIAGERSVRLKARDDDELKGLIEKINAVLEKFDTKN